MWIKPLRDKKKDYERVKSMYVNELVLISLLVEIHKEIKNYAIIIEVIKSRIH